MPRDIFSPSKGFIPFVTPFDISPFHGPSGSQNTQAVVPSPSPLTHVPPEVPLLGTPLPSNPLVTSATDLQASSSVGVVSSQLPAVDTLLQPPKKRSGDALPSLDDSLSNIQNSSFLDIMVDSGDSNVFEGNVTSSEDNISEGLFFFFSFVSWCFSQPYQVVL